VADRLADSNPSSTPQVCHDPLGGAPCAVCGVSDEPCEWLPESNPRKRLSTRWFGIEVLPHPRAPGNGPRVWTVLLRIGRKAKLI
jgi:hypothetical protein